VGRHYHFKAGSFYRVDDRTGLVQRAEATRKEWNGLIVDQNLWEARQPQDLVRGVPDRQSVEDARPLAPAQFVGPIYLTLSADAPPKSPYITVQSPAGVTLQDRIGVMMDNGVLWPAIIVGLPPISAPDTFLIFPPLPLDAASGNEVVDYRTRGVAAGQYLVTEDGQVMTTEDGTPIVIYS
jgi:hypothetical protein